MGGIFESKNKKIIADAYSKYFNFTAHVSFFDAL